MNYTFKDRRIFLAIFIVGLFLVEGLLSMWTGMAYDMKIWFQTGNWMNQGTNIYLPNDHLGYPPLWALWCLASYHIFNLSGSSMEIWRFTIKLPLLLAQFALAFAMWKFAKKRFNPRTAWKIFWLALTWVFFIYVGALLGQLNMLSALLTFLAFYAVISKKTIIGAILLGIAITLKIFPLITIPAFAAFIWKNFGKKETGKFMFLASAMPVVFTFAVFAIYRWDMVYFLKTIFYWAPVFDANPVQMQGGLMNIWSFTSLLNVDIAQVSILRFVWIPILAATSVYWFKKPKMGERDLNLSLISFYVLFMLSYAWVPEQAFLDVLPFIFLQIFIYRPKRFYVLMLGVTQVLVFAFSTFNWGPFIFAPLLTRFSPDTLQAIQFLDPKNSIVWTARGVMGFAVSVSLIVFLFALAKPELFERSLRRIWKRSSIVPLEKEE